MADKKISQLTAATTPLDGTEVLPIVQSGSTVKVQNNDLRPKQIQSNATSGVLQIVGPAASTTRVMTTPNANFTAARTDAAQTFTGTQTFSSDAVINTLTVGLGTGSVATNTAVGYQSAFSNTSGTLTAIGWKVLYNNTTGISNTAIGGYEAGNYNPTLYANNTGSGNSAVGVGALNKNTSGNYNNAFGIGALPSVTTGSNNTAMGSTAGLLTTGSNNSFFGYQSGYSVTSGGKNTIIGSYTGAGAPISGTGSNYVVFSDGDGNVRGYYDSNGNLIVPVAAKGINFTANTPAAGMTSQLLNWYEEGTWTPDVVNNGSTSTWATKTGYYTRVGNQLTLWYLCDSGNSGTAGTELRLSGFPFAYANTIANLQAGTMLNNGGSATFAALQMRSGTYARVVTDGGTTVNSQITYATGTLTFQI